MKSEKITFSNITFRYEGQSDAAAALVIPSLALEAGKRYLITGACGSGKTTLVMLLKGLVKPTSGSIEIKETDKTLSEIRHTMGFAFQFPEEQFFKETVEEEIGFGPLLLGCENVSERVEESLTAVGLCFEDFARRSPFELSFGEKRRVAIASIIACNPSWYIFDEPTAGLDPEGKRALLELLERFTGPGKTMLIITQELGLFSRLSDEIILLDQGKVLAKRETKAFFDTEGSASVFSCFPYHIQVLAGLRDRGWDLPVSILDPSEAASRIVSSVL
jgi:energy-coupling factor transport system ATP-binding protein